MRGMIVGIVALAGIACALPAAAEELVVRGPGVAVGVGEHHDRDVVERRVYHRDHDFARGHCRTTIIKTEGMTRKIKKCD